MDLESADADDWSVVGSPDVSEPLARPIQTHAPRLTSRYHLDVDGRPTSEIQQASGLQVQSSAVPRPAGSPLPRPDVLSRSAGWRPVLLSSTAKPLARPTRDRMQPH